MSCLNLRLPPAKKAWKNFTSKLLTRLRKLHKFKAMKKPKNRQYVITKTTAKARMILIDQHKNNMLQSHNKALRLRQNRDYLFKKKAGPVYIDKLFKHPIVAAELVAEYPLSGGSVKEEKACATGSAADDMWESLALGSPQMHGIDQRAEEFIQSFRAELELQEMMARRL